MGTELIGWASALVLLATVTRQVWKQYRLQTSEGVSKWLFIGQMAASTGFVVYSVLVANWVFVVTNVLMLVAAITGQLIYMRNRRRDERRGIDAGATPPDPA